ncbi:MAG: helix-hairpin-helix domain-containing protein [Candidatus Promineifilaceae bacterium]
MKENKRLLGGILSGVFSGIIITVLVMVLSRPIRPAAIEIRAPEPTAPLPTAPPLPTETPTVLHVFVSGAVSVSDVYDLPPGSLVKDAIVMAGGFTADANRDVVNQALRVQDGDHIHVPTMQETAVTPPIISNDETVSGNAPAESGTNGVLVNINTASLGELESLPGIGPALAQNIVDYREANGPFEMVEDIMHVSGIGTAKFEAIRELIIVQ